MSGTGGAAGTGGTPGTGGTVAISTGIDGGKMLNALDAQETEKLCTAVKSLFMGSPALAPNLCLIVAVVATQLDDPPTDMAAQMSCQMAYGDCTGSVGEGLCGAVTPGCTATVSQLEACWSATPSYIAGVAAPIPACAALTLKDLQTIASTQPPPQPAACVTLDNLGCADLDLTGNE